MEVKDLKEPIWFKQFIKTHQHESSFICVRTALRTRQGHLTPSLEKPLLVQDLETQIKMYLSLGVGIVSVYQYRDSDPKRKAKTRTV